MAAPMRFTDADVQRFARHVAGCAACRQQHPCAEGAALLRPLTQRLADDIDADIAEKTYADLKRPTWAR